MLKSATRIFDNLVLNEQVASKWYNSWLIFTTHWEGGQIPPSFISRPSMPYA